MGDPTRLIGRSQEARAASQHLLRPAVHLLTLTGPGGVGKSRLAQAIAQDLGHAFADGVVWVDLASVGDPDFVLPTIAEALGLHATDGASALEHLKSVLRARTLLLFLDNFEQVLDSAPQVGHLLAECPGLKILATSRAPLHLRWEHEMAVPPLAVPDLAALPGVDRLSDNPSVALFVERAHAVLADFQLSVDNSASIAALCVRLDGLPLGLELAAARVKLLTPELILARLEQRLDVLGGGNRDQPLRHRTVRAAIDWSHDLLPVTSQVVFRRLSIFDGGWTLEAAEAVCAGEGIVCADVLDHLGDLVDQSLVSVHRDVGAPARYHLLETIRQYAREQLDRSGECEAIRSAHALYFQTVARGLEPQLARPQARSWLARSAPDRDNLRTALQWSVDHAESTHATRLGAVLWQTIEYGLTATEGVDQDTPTRAATSVLTAREQEVAVLVGRGYSNQAIADELVIGRRTAETHVERILNKLAFASRTQVGVWAAEHGLLSPDPAAANRSGG